MAYRRRFRKRRGLWLPIDGTNVDTQPANNIFLDSSSEGVIAVDYRQGEYNLNEFHITYDTPAQGNVNAAAYTAGVIPTLSDFLASGYSLQRIVGKLSIIHQSSGALEVPTQLAPAGVRVGAGFMVRRVDEQGSSLAPITDLNPLLSDNIQDPWIWRNTWDLGMYPNQGGGVPYGIGYGSVISAVAQMPNSNLFGGTQKSGPFFDIKTKRSVLAEERLFFDIATVRLPLLDSVQVYGPLSINSTVYYHLDVRVFAYPLRTMGNRRNATR